MRRAVTTIAAAAAMAIGATSAEAAFVRYDFTGVTRPFDVPAFRNQPISGFFILDTTTPDVDPSADRSDFQGAVVDAGLTIFGETFHISASPTTNHAITRLNVPDVNFGPFNGLNISVTSDGIARGPVQFPGTIALTVIDRLGLIDDAGMVHDFTGLGTPPNGSVVLSMGAFDAPSSPRSPQAAAER